MQEEIFFQKKKLFLENIIKITLFFIIFKIFVLNSSFQNTNLFYILNLSLEKISSFFMWNCFFEKTSIISILKVFMLNSFFQNMSSLFLY